MPGFNGTGPQGNGPFTGRGRGYCAQEGVGMTGGHGMGQGRGRGGSQGRGRGARGLGLGQGAAVAMARDDATSRAAMTPQDYLAWLESELARTRETIGREG